MSQHPRYQEMTCEQRLAVFERLQLMLQDARIEAAGNGDVDMQETISVVIGLLEIALPEIAECDDAEAEFILREAIGILAKNVAARRPAGTLH